MRDLVDTTEMYLRTIYELEEEGITPLRARIAERLEQSGPTVSQTVARMERDGLLVVQPDRSLQMTESGRQTAISVMRKHRLAERLLTDVLGLDIHQVHDEACRWEHVMSEDVEKRVVAVLEDTERSPFGNPIPGLEELNLEGVTGNDHVEHGERAVDIVTSEPQRAQVVQLNEILQFDADQFKALVDAGIQVGSIVYASLHSGVVVLTTEDGVGEVELADEFAHAVRLKVLGE